MRLRISLTLTIGDKPSDPVTVDLVGTHHEIPEARYPAGFGPPEEDNR